MVIFHSLKVDFIDILKSQSGIHKCLYMYESFLLHSISALSLGSPKLKKPTAPFVAAWHCISPIYLEYHW